MNGKMFWIIVSLGLFIAVSNTAFADDISLSIESGPCGVDKGAANKASFAIEGFATRGEAGKPMLQERTYAVLLPPDVVPASVKIEVTGAESEALPGVYDVPPAAPDMAWSGDRLIEDWGTAKSLRDGKNMDIYGSDAL